MKKPVKSMQKTIKNRLRAKTKKSKNTVILYPWLSETKNTVRFEIPVIDLVENILISTSKTVAKGGKNLYTAGVEIQNVHTIESATPYALSYADFIC
jgi:hypothetical protein